MTLPSVVGSTEYSVPISAIIPCAWTATKLAAEYFERFPKDRYQTEVESWRHLQSQNIEFTMKRLRELVDGDAAGG